VVYDEPEQVIYTNCDIVYKYDWDTSIAKAICLAESGGNPNASNPTDNHMSWAGCMGSYGLFQINCSHGQVFDPEENVQIAYEMYKSKGWTPWSTYTSGRYLNFK